MDDNQGQAGQQQQADDKGDAVPHPSSLPVLVCEGGMARSSCCRAEVERTANYTDNHVFSLDVCGTDGHGVVTWVQYTFVKTYDGMDAEDVEIHCTECGQQIDTEGVDLYQT